MNPSELIILRERLERLNLDELSELALTRQESISTLFDDYGDDQDFGWMDQKFAQLMSDLNTIEGVVKLRIGDINKQIELETKKRMAGDNSHWSHPNVRFKTAEYNRDFRQLPLSADAKSLIHSRVGFYTNWQYPGLEIGPRDGEWTQSLVACDPLYVVDYNDECLKATRAQFNSKYQNRLRCYLYSGNGLHMLPKGQFGFVFSWNTFNYFSMDQIYLYLQDIKSVLRPGGACMFSYNNAERAISARKAEDQLMSFVPKKELIMTLEELGFIDITTHDVDSSVSWVEFRKPGKLETYRTGQTLGKIIFAHDVKA